MAEQLRDAATYERAILDALERAVGFDHAFFVSLGERPTPALERAFAARTYDHELWPLKLAARRARGVAVDTQLFGEAEVRRRDRDLVGPAGGRHTLLRGRPLGVID